MNLATVEIGEVDPKELHANQSDYTIIDVRTAEEFTGDLGHIPGSEHQELGPALEDWLKQADKDKKYAFICRSGRRSDMAARTAKLQGFADTTNMVGGMIAWNEAKLDVER